MKDFTEDISPKVKIIEATSVEDALQKINDQELAETDTVSGSVKIHQYSLFHFQDVKVEQLRETLSQIKEMSGESFEFKDTV